MLKCYFLNFFVGAEVDVEAEVEAVNGAGENQAEIEIANGCKSKRKYTELKRIMELTHMRKKQVGH